MGNRITEFIGSLFEGKKELSTAKVKELIKGSGEVAVPTTISSQDRVKRVPPQELEDCYIFDPVVFNSINKLVQTIMSAGYELRCEDQNVLTWFKDFLNNIGDVGEDTTFEELLYTIFQNELIYGKHYIERVFNKPKSRIVDLVSLDPKQMDYARTESDKIVLDSFGKPIGYTQKIPFGVDTTDKGDPAPENVSLKDNRIFILPERIAHFKLYTYGNRFEGLGIIEPGYKSIIRKHNIEEANTNSIYTKGSYPLVVYVGDKDHYPTPDKINNAAEQIAKLQHNRFFAFPYWYKVEPIEVKQSEIADNSLKYLRENISASLGMPIAFATGSGEATNRATLTNQQKFLEFTLNDIVKRTVRSIEKQIFRKIAELKGFKVVPHLVWGDVGAENKDDKAARINQYVKNGVLSPEDARAYALRSEELSEPQSGELSKKTLGGWMIGEQIEPMETNELSKLDSETLIDYHEKLHVYWDMLKKGFSIPDWSFTNITEAHRDVVQLFELKNIEHIFINDLDTGHNQHGE